MRNTYLGLGCVVLLVYGPICLSFIHILIAIGQVRAAALLLLSDTVL